MAERSIPSEGIEGFALSQDGSGAQLQIGNEPNGDTVFWLVPTAKLPALLLQLQGLVDQLRMGGVLPPAPRLPNTTMVGKWKVGSNTTDPRLKDYTAVLFEEGGSKEALYLLPKLDALRLADAIEQQVLADMAPAEQQRLIKEVERGRGGKPRILMPNAPQRRH